MNEEKIIKIIRWRDVFRKKHGVIEEKIIKIIRQRDVFRKKHDVIEEKKNDF